MEALGFAASIASLHELSGRIATAGYGYIPKVVQAPGLRMVLRKVLSASLVLGCLEQSFVHQSGSGGTRGFSIRCSAMNSLRTAKGCCRR